MEFVYRVPWACATRIREFGRDATENDFAVKQECSTLGGIRQILRHWPITDLVRHV